MLSLLSNYRTVVGTEMQNFRNVSMSHCSHVVDTAILLISVKSTVVTPGAIIKVAAYIFLASLDATD